MAKEKKTIIFIVEGSSDKAALENIFKKIYRRNKEIDFGFTNGDITSDPTVTIANVENRAHAEYIKELSSSRKGIRTSPERLLELNDLLMPLVNKGQSINHIFATHSDEIRLSKKTIYNYIDQSAFRVRNIDLPKKVRYKQRHSHEVLMKFDYQYRKGRTYTDFTSFMEQNPKLPIVEMDTVIGARNSGKVLLTILFRDTNFMLIFLLPDKSHQSVLHVFDKLTSLLGIELFRKLFPVRMRKHVIR